MIAATVYNAVVDSLANNPALSDYIKNVFKGLRYEIDPTSLPCICVEPTQNNLIEQEMNNYQRIYMHLDIMAFTSNMSNPEKAIVGDQNYRGVLDIENDIRACLESSNTLGGKVYNIEFDPTVFGYKDYPVRGLVIPVKILYSQLNTI